jgi:prepilin-type N-terminal cleavage/methylation domain-containing protein
VAPYRRVRRLSWLSRNEPEDGFTLVEVLIAMLIIGTVLVVMGATMYTAFGSIGFSRQRDTATQFANQAIEQIKALNFNDLEMSASDLSGDTLVSGCPAACVFAGRTIPNVSSGTLPASPLNPHISAPPPVVAGSAYTIASYITFDTSQNTQDRVATVRVTWNHPAQGTNALVQIESTIFANGALAAPPAHAWTADALDSAGNISVSGTLLGTSLADVKFGPGSARATIAVDGTATATGNVDESHVQLLGQTLLKTNASAASASSAPGQGVSAPAATVVSNSSVLGPQPGAGIVQLINLILQLVSGNIGLNGPAGTVATTQAVAASSANGSVNVSNGAGGLGTMPNSNLPYAEGLSQQTGPVYLGLSLNTLLILPQALQILSITPLGNNSPDLATVCQQTTPGCQNAMPATGNVSGASQPSYSGAAIEAQAQKSFSDITVLPLLGTPLLQISGFSAAASAAAGPGLSNTGLAKINALSVKLLGASVPVSQLLSGVASNGSTTVSLGLLGIANVGVHLNFGSTTPAGTNPAIVTSPLTLTVTVSVAGLLNLTVNVGFGNVTATANYS